PRDQAGEDADRKARLQEMHRAVREHDVGPRGGEAIDFPIVGAIDGARPVESGPVGLGTFAPQQASRGPRAAAKPDVRDWWASLPQLRPARALGHRYRAGGAIKNVRQAPCAVDREDSLVIP